MAPLKEVDFSMQYFAPDQPERDRFHAGSTDCAYRWLGAHPVDENGVPRWHFAVWAPNAQAVSLVGEFCGWDQHAYPLVKQYDGIWEIRVDDAKFHPEIDPERFSFPEAAERLTAYKYAVTGPDGQTHIKGDPFAFQCEKRPNNASRLKNLDGFVWHDGSWMEKRRTWDPFHSPINIYEMHLGTWRRGEDGRVLTYSEIADRTHLSTATITRVNRALRYGNDGYAMVLDRIVQ